MVILITTLPQHIMLCPMNEHDVENLEVTM